MCKNQFYLMPITIVLALVINVWVANVYGKVGDVFESVIIDPARCDYCTHCAPLKGDKVDDSVELLELRRIANPEPHQSLVFTDLEIWNDKLYCTFRVGTGHGVVGDNAIIRIIVSDDGVKWETTGELKIEGHDLRDPKLSVTPDNHLMVSTVKRHYNNGKWTHQSLSYFSADGRKGEGPYEVGPVNRWLWRTTWHDGRAYNIDEGGSFVRLYKSRDGKNFETLVDRLFDKNGPDEHAMVFLPDDTAPFGRRWRW